MKKLFLTLGLCMATVCSTMAATAYTLAADNTATQTNAKTINAEEVIGKWESNTIKTEPSPEMPMAVTEKYVIEYKADNKVSLTSNASLTVEIDANVFVDVFPTLMGEGTYAVAGDSITINLEQEKCSLKFTADDVRIRGIEDALMIQTLQEQIYENFKLAANEMVAGMGSEPMVIKNVLIFNKQMTGIIDSEAVTFKRKKK